MTFPTRSVRPRSRLAAAALCLTLGSGAVFAQTDAAPTATLAPPATRAEDGGRSATVVRTYDVSDLVRAVPDYPLEDEPNGNDVAAARGGGGGGGGGGLYSNQGGGAAGAKPPTDGMDGLIALIQAVVAPETWRAAGGSVGDLRPFGPGSLVVVQTSANHQAVQTLLESLRRDAASGTVVEVQARWVLVTPEQLTAWRAAERRQQGEAEGAANLRAAVDDLLRDEGAVVCRASTVGFNGQTVGLTSGRTATVVTQVSPQVGQGAALYDFRTGQERTGVSLQVTPRYAPQQGTVTVDVHSTVTGDLAGGGGPDGAAKGVGARDRQPGSRSPAVDLAVATAGLGASATQPSGGDVADAARRVAAALERQPRVEQRFRTTVRVRPGVPVIIGGMTLEPGKAGSRQLCLLIDARPVEPPAGGKPRDAAGPRR